MSSDVVDALLRHLEKNALPSSAAWAAEHGFTHEAVIGAIKSLESLNKTKSLQLTANGERTLEHGSPERRLYEAIDGDEGSTMEEISAKIGDEDAKAGRNHCMRAKWVTFDKATKKLRRVAEKQDEVARDAVQETLRAWQRGDAAGTSAEAVKLLEKSRKMLTQVTTTVFSVEKGEAFRLEVVRPETELTAALMHSGEWRTKTIKEPNLHALGAPAVGGHLHPLLKARSEYRAIFLEMGFAEMNTQRWVESSFWNFDTLFIAQQHPARDMQDTFFVSQPRSATIDEQLVATVAAIHENGGDTGSIGHRSGFSREVAARNILRTHTTAVTARVLHRLGEQARRTAPGTPFEGKYFSIDRVFRNETIDQTHLAEFHQIEAFVAAKGLTLGDLIGTLETFYKKIGIDRLRFKPAYNPYTEPSMEVYGWHDGLRKWMELGNSGMFRPEMLIPLGVPADVRVIAFGLGVERPAMIHYGLSDIRELYGHRLNLEFVEQNPLFRLKESAATAAAAAK